MNIHPVLTVQLPMAAVVLVIGILLALMPRLTRPSLFFAVTVPPAFRDTPEGRRIAARYRALVVAGTILGIALALFLAPAAHPWAAGLSPIVVLAFALAAFLDARRRVLPHAVAPAPEREASLAPRAVSLPGGWAGQAGPFAILAAAAAWLASQWSHIPARFPVHWGLDGRPDAWARPTPWSVYGTLVVAAALCGLLVLVAVGIVRWSRRVRTGGDAGRRELRFRRLVLTVVLAAEYLIASVNGWVAILPLTGLRRPGRTIWPVLGLVSLAMILLVVLLVRTGQGGSRLGGETETDAPVGDRTDDRYWKAGLFYVNRNDPAIFVEKRFGIGYTVNFGNPWSWVILGALLLPGLILWLLAR